MRYIVRIFGVLLVSGSIAPFGISAQMSEEQAAKSRAFHPEWYVTHNEFGRTPSEIYAEILAKVNDPNHTPDLGDITAEDLQPYLGEWASKPGKEKMLVEKGYIFISRQKNQEYVLKFRVLKKLRHGLILQTKPVFFRMGEGHMHSALKLWEGQGIWYWAYWPNYKGDTF